MSRSARRRGFASDTSTIVLGLAVATLGLSPAAALGKHGADDGVASSGDDKGGLRDHRGGDDNGGLRDRNRDGKRVTGTCTDGSAVKLKVKPDDGRLEVEFEVDQNRDGVRWKVRVRRNGKLVIKTSAVTQAPSGSFSVERKIRNPAGRDRIAARATSPDGEVCKAALSI